MRVIAIDGPAGSGKSTVLRNKRQELVSKRSEFAEIGMKAALAAASYRLFDPDNNGSIEPVDIVRAFANVRKSDGDPWVPVEKAHAIAQLHGRPTIDLLNLIEDMDSRAVGASR